jgi:hypothetical protein
MKQPQLQARLRVEVRAIHDGLTDPTPTKFNFKP